MAYTPTGTFIPCKTNGFITDKYSKSYKFSIVKPTTYPGEENVNGVIWVLDIEAMGKSTDPNERQRATWAAGRDYSDRDNPVDYPLVGNYYIVGNLYSFPTENPRNKIPLDENNYKLCIPLAFTSSESIYSFQKSLIRESFGCKLYDWYGNAERSIALQEEFNEYKEDNSQKKQI